MKAIFDAAHNDHDPQFFLQRGQVRRTTEVPERADRLLAGLNQGKHEILPPRRFGLGPLAAVHTPEYLDFLATAHAAWQAIGDSGPEIIPNIHPSRYPPTYPDSIVGRAGWHMADTACPIGPATWRAAQLAADVALTAAELVIGGERAAYALCRPPGHHAYADMAGGFCFLNNTAIVAQHLRRRHDRVAILDVDVHHGNGTQGIFYRRGDVLTVSIHADPHFLYPFYWGHAHERGEGAGEGCNLNLPLPYGADDDRFLAAVARATDRIRMFQPDGAGARPRPRCLRGRSLQGSRRDHRRLRAHWCRCRRHRTADRDRPGGRIPVIDPRRQPRRDTARFRVSRLKFWLQRSNRGSSNARKCT